MKRINLVDKYSLALMAEMWRMWIHLDHVRQDSREMAEMMDQLRGINRIVTYDSLPIELRVMIMTYWLKTGEVMEVKEK